MRRKPMQKRSQEMVDKILEATARTIEERGIEFITTNHVADNAGVNIATLYHYFHDKNDLIEAMLEKICRDTTRTVAQNMQLMDKKKPDLRTITRKGIQHGIRFLRSNNLYLELLRNWQSLPVEGALNYLEDYFIQLSRDYFARHFLEYPIADLHPRLYVLINCVLLLIVRYLGNYSPPITEDELIDTVTDMMVLLMEHGARKAAS